MTASKRKPRETYAQYRARLRREARAEKNRLQGKGMYVSGQTPIRKDSVGVNPEARKALNAVLIKRFREEL